MLSMDRDRLLALSSYRPALRHARLDSPEAVRRASREQLAGLGPHRAAIVGLVRVGDADVMRALFVPQDELDWQAALLASDPGARLLTVWRGQTTLLKRTYRVADGEDDERWAWAGLKSVLRAGMRSGRASG
jgi:hypothetical protein